ncbi:MAG: LLM class oxidoreductase [Bacteroidota bacterium]
MPIPPSPSSFSSINKAYQEVFRPQHMSIGLVVPIETYIHSSVPDMHGHLERVQLAEALGFKAIWLRDVPFHVPAFGDAGQPYDPFVYLGMLAAKTRQIALGVASIILPLRHPVHVAKAAASVDALSEGRLLLGIASGDRPKEYPAMNIPFEERGARFRESYAYIRAMEAAFPQVSNDFGELDGALDLLPKAFAAKLPLLITGGSQQPMEWIAAHGDGWMVYPRNPIYQEHVLKHFREKVAEANRPPQPVMQPLHIDLAEDPNQLPTPIHLGFRSGIKYLLQHLKALQNIGIHHVALNLRFNQADVESTLQEIAKEILPAFHP